MIRLLKELVALIIVIAVAAVIIFLFTRNIQTRYDTFTASIYKIPVNISSPVYGEILTMPIAEGDTVTQGQTLATIQIFSSNGFKPSADNTLFKVKGDVLSVQSPSDGVVASIDLAAQSTVGGTQAFMQIYTLSNLEIQVLIPQGDDISNYSAFYASITPNSTKFSLKILGQLPTDVLHDIPPTTTVYRATCRQTSDCQNIIDNESVSIEAQKKQASSLFPSLPFSLPFSL